MEQTALEFEKQRSKRIGENTIIKLEKTEAYINVYDWMTKLEFNTMRFDSILSKRNTNSIQHICINGEYVGKNSRGIFATFLKKEGKKIWEKVVENENDVVCVRFIFFGGKDEKGLLHYSTSIRGTINPRDGAEAKTFCAIV